MVTVSTASYEWRVGVKALSSEEGSLGVAVRSEVNPLLQTFPLFIHPRV
jgi:hypothetical protein